MSSTEETATVGPELPPSRSRGAWPAGQTIAERYEVKEFLGHGGYSLVYRVYDRLLGVEVALKAVRPDRDPERMLVRLRREVAIAREALSPNLVQVFDLGRTEDDIYLTMELMEGGPLRRRLEAGRLSLPETVRVAESLLRGLAVLHARGAVHRDVTPGNILFSGTGEVKLGDFGLARRPERDETAFTARDAILGTEGYRSPEQALGKEVGPKSDLYSLGVVLFEMLTGRLPHEASSDFGRRLSVLEKAPDVRRLRPEVPPWLARIVARLLEVRLRDRYQSAEEALRDLTLAKSPRRVRLWRRLLWAAALLFLVLPPTGVVLVPAPGARFSRLVPLGEDGIAAIGTRGEELWRLRGVDPEAAGKWALARITADGPPLIAIVLSRRWQWSPEDVSTLSFLDPGTGGVVKRVELPNAVNRFPDDPPRFSISSVRALDLFHDGTDAVIVSYRHVPEAPSYAVLYMPRRNEARVIYFSRGHQDFQGATDLDGDGIPELLFAGIDNGWNWVNVVAAVRLPSSLPVLEAWDIRPATAPNLVQEPMDERALLWYAVVPRGYLEDPHRLTIDEARREITVHYASGRAWTLGFDGFPPGLSSGDQVERQGARRETYEHFWEAERLHNAGHLDLAMSESKAAQDSANRAQETWLSQYAERLQGKILVAEGRALEAEALFASLVERAEDAPEVSYDAAVAFHLAGDLPRAVAWYEKGMGRESAMGAGKSKHEFLKGEVLALVEEKRYAEALRAVDRFDATYPIAVRDPLWREYIRWRAGGRPEANPAGMRPNATDLSRYWELEFEAADGSEPQEILPRLDRFLAERPETRAETLSLRAELLSRLGRTQEAAATAQSALELARGKASRSIIARGHLSLLEERARHLTRVARANDRPGSSPS